MFVARWSSMFTNVGRCSYKKHDFHTDIGAGVVDSDYRGPVGVVMFNHADSDLQIEKGDRVAQLVIEQISTQPLVVVDGDLDDTERGEGGFGSTGK